MKRIILVTLAAAWIAATTPTDSAVADSGPCDAVLADLPVLTDQIQTEWVVDNCPARIQVRVTLGEYIGGDWQRADCSSNDSGQCTRVHPRDSEFAACDPFYCAYGTNHQIDTWRQDDGSCSHPFRTKVTVLNRDGDVIASDVSPANACS